MLFAGLILRMVFVVEMTRLTGFQILESVKFYRLVFLGSTIHYICAGFK